MHLNYCRSAFTTVVGAAVSTQKNRVDYMQYGKKTGLLFAATCFVVKRIGHHDVSVL